MKNKKIIISISSLIILLLFGGSFSGRDDLYLEISKNIDLFGKVYKEISLNYVDDVNPTNFIREGINGMLSSLDPYTVFIDETKNEDINLITSGKYGGVGITIGVRGNKVTVIEVLDGYSAQKQGIRIGDILLQADSVKITEDNVNEISSLVKGEPGSTVQLKVLRNDDKDTLIFNLIREEVKVKNLIYYGFYPKNSNNVYLKLTNFSRSAGDEIKNALRELKAKKKIGSVILDLRGNPGGLLDVAVDIVDKFIEPNKLIVTTKGRDETSYKDYYSEEIPLLDNKTKVVLLINNGSASASEIVAGAIQDHDRGVILGTKSFGKGLVQTITPLSFNTSLKITTAKYYTPSGRCIQKIDYSKNNKVLAPADSLSEKKYFTDNKRPVFSAGGITPDTTVEFNIEGGITLDLLAKGLIFKFADHLYYSNPKEDYTKFTKNVVLKEFKKYLSDANYSYKSNAEKNVVELLAYAERNKLNPSLIENIIKVKQQFGQIDNDEFQIYQDEIFREIISEVAARFKDIRAREEEMLKHDKQFLAAYSIVQQDSIYNKLLSIK